MPGWNIADVLEVVARAVPEAPALIQGGGTLSWGDLDRRAGQLAAYLSGLGLRRQDKVVQYLRNCPEYLESFIGALKASLVPVNTNYRYASAELSYLWQDCDARVVVFAGSFTTTIEQMRASVPEVAVWLWVDDGTGSCPAWAVPYESAAAPSRALPLPWWQRDGDDLILLYTGGTTGLPKGVMWRQDDLMIALGNATGGRYPDEPDLGYARSRIAVPGRRHLPAAPLMHGTGCLTCLPVLARGGAVVLLAQPTFQAAELLDAVEQHRVNSVGWVGDAFARPVLAALDAEPGHWDLGSWSVLTSGGVLFSEEVKQGLLRHAPGLVIADVYGSSEAIAAARSVSRAGTSGGPARSFAGPCLTVLSDDGNPVIPGSGVIGRVAFSGRMPLGYYKDESKAAETFVTVRGRRYALTGDFATVAEDGQVIVLGRGSSCINTGGEKVYPEEVEDVLKRHPSVADAAVLGLPDERFGEKIAAAIELADGWMLDADALRVHVRARLAGYKVPRHLIAVDEVVRGPSGKVDVLRMRRLLEADHRPMPQR